MEQSEIKKAVGGKAAELIHNGMIVGLGSGSTSECFIHSLSERVQQGLQIKAVSSSKKSLKLAEQKGIQVSDINEIPRIDITVDGADEIDSQKRMIKGGGGAHVREKILASSSKEMVVILDESKLVENLGKTKLPVEVLFFGSPATKMKIENMDFHGSWRLQKDGSLFITDNGNILMDIHFKTPLENPEKVHEMLINIPGVVDTGFFFHIAGRVIIGFENGHIEIK